MIDNKLHLDLKFIHLMGGMSAAAPTRTSVFRSLKEFHMGRIPRHHRSMRHAQGDRRRRGRVNDALVRDTVEKWGSAEFGEDMPRLWCQCHVDGCIVCKVATP